MNIFDLIFVILFAWAGYKGFSKGFVKSLATLAALVLGVWGAIRFSAFTSVILIDRFDAQSEYLPLIAFAVTFLVIVIGIHLLATLLDKLLAAVALGIVNRIAGIVFNLFKMAFFISIILVILNKLHEKYGFLPEQKTEESVLYEPLSSLAPVIFPYLHFEQIREQFFRFQFEMVPEDEEGDDQEYEGLDEVDEEEKNKRPGFWNRRKEKKDALKDYKEI